ncbi:MAG: hypothetical protein ACRD2R_03880, partial [Terriglobales bacterium]
MSTELAVSVILLAVVGAIVFVRPWMGLVFLLLAGAMGKFAVLPELDIELMDALGSITVWAALI